MLDYAYMEKTQVSSASSSESATFAVNKAIFAAALQARHEQQNEQKFQYDSVAHIASVAVAHSVSTPSERSVRRRQSRTGNGYSAQ